jgi:hypothetical protein
VLPVILSLIAVQVAPGYEARRTSTDAATLLPADAPQWKDAREVVWGPEPYRTRFRALWNEHGLHLRFDSEDDAPWFTMTERDDRLWEEEVVEIFLDPLGDGRYVEVELNPANVVCDLRRLGPGETASDPIGPMDRGFAVTGMRTAVAAADGRWIGTLLLPWEGLGLSGAPGAGEEIPFNVFRIKRPGGPEAPEEGAVFAAWSPTGGPSFHVPEAFRPLRLVR